MWSYLNEHNRGVDHSLEMEGATKEMGRRSFKDGRDKPIHYT